MCGRNQILMTDRGRIKVNEMKIKSHDRPGQERTNHRADTDGTAQMPTEESSNRQHDDADSTDRNTGKPPFQSDKKSIAGTAAERSAHIEKLCHPFDNNANQQEWDSRYETILNRHQVEPVKKIDTLANKHRIQYHPQSDGLPQHDIDENNNQRYDNRS